MKVSEEKELKPIQQSLYFPDLVEQVYSHLPTSLLANILLSLPLVVVLWGKVTHQKLIIWIAVLWAITIVRFVQYITYRSRKDGPVRNWAFQFNIGVILTGIVWGLTGFFLFPEFSILHQVFLAFVLGGLIAGATVSIAAMQSSLKIFVCLVVIPLVFRFLFIGGEVHYAMGGMLALYGGFCIVMSSQIYTMLITSIRLQYENKEEIEERKKAEDKLVRQKVFLEAVLSNVEDAIVACDDEGNLSFFNRAAQTFHGVEQKNLPPEEWAANYDLYLADGVTPMQKEDIPLFRAFRGETLADVEMIILPKQGKRRTLLSSGRPLIDDSGKKYGALVSMHDITERKKAEDFLKRAHQELEIKVQERTNELRKALAEVKTLRGILPICSHCKKIRNDEGYYEQIELYIHKHSGVDFSHTICPACIKKYYPEYHDISQEDRLEKE